ncbi:pilin [Schlegelella sp. S2-27]|uniref:Pilin n=1 Tax=Caldimonas mangrovi TaxID=2944811 RepID=A0ABT0YK41_9BURK|nr:pilin [Caldimonas mangrovi]
MSEALGLASAAKATVGENISNNGGVMPADACVGVAPTVATTNVASTACDAASGMVTVVTTAAAGNVTLTLTPAAPGAAGGAITWDCSITAGETRHVPAECR